MQSIDQAYDTMRRLVEQVTGGPAPEVGPQGFLPFPAGCDPVAFAVNEVEQLRRILGPEHDNRKTGTAESHEPCFCPRADVFGGESGLCFRVETPGVAQQDLYVTVAGHELVVRGRRRAPESSDGLRPLAVEQPWGALERRFPLPMWAHSEAIEAHYADGVLEITVNRGSDESAERRIEIE
jgi:HSP20 family molecular chaperone IbpA